MSRTPTPIPYIWTLDQTKKLIDILKNHRHLWDKRTSEFRSIGTMRGLELIINLLGMPNMTQKQLRCKLRNLKTTYKIELRKIQAAEQRGFFYRPTLAWFKDFQGVMDHLEEEVFEEDTPNSETYVVSIKQEYIENARRGDIGSIEFDEQLQTKDDKLKLDKNEDQDEIEMNLEHYSSVEPPMDEFQLFADHVAEQLRLVSPDTAQKLQKEIESLLDTYNKDQIQLFES